MADGGRFVVAGQRPWNRATFERHLAGEPGRWSFAADQAELAEQLADRPQLVFFLHWSDLVPEETTSTFECVCFHMTDVPFGRGGSPLQNLIDRGIRVTQLSALKMTAEVDAGPVYAKVPLELWGTAEEIYMRADVQAVGLIRRIVSGDLVPVDQSGPVTRFRRRTPAQSALTGDLADLDAVADFIRMLDAEGYPHAFVDVGPFRVTFTGATRYLDRIEARAVVRRRDGTEEGRR
jgi:methionyl-tRNA formyltransferase